MHKMLEPPRRHSSEHRKRASRAGSIFLRHCRLAFIAWLMEVIHSGQRRFEYVATTAVDFFIQFKASVGKLGGLALGLLLLALMFWSARTFSNAHNVVLLGQILTVLLALCVIAGFLLIIVVGAGQVWSRTTLLGDSSRRPLKRLTNEMLRKLATWGLALWRTGSKLWSQIVSGSARAVMYVVRAAPSAIFFSGRIKRRSSSRLPDQTLTSGRAAKAIYDTKASTPVETARRAREADKVEKGAMPANLGIEGAYNRPENTGVTSSIDRKNVNETGADGRDWFAVLWSVPSSVQIFVSGSSEPDRASQAPSSANSSDKARKRNINLFSYSFYSRSYNSIAILALEFFNYSRNSFSVANVSVLAMSIVSLAILSQSANSISVSAHDHGDAGKIDRAGVDGCDLCMPFEVSLERYWDRVYAFVLPRRNFDVGLGSYNSWRVGDSNLEIKFPAAEAYCQSAVVIVVGMSSRSGSLSLNQLIAEKRSSEALRAVEATMNSCPIDARSRLIRVAMAERHMHAADASERVSLFLLSDVGEVSFDRIVMAIDAALREDIGLVRNTEESYLHVSCPTAQGAGDQSGWLVSDAIVALADPWMRDCVFRRITAGISKDLRVAREGSLAIADRLSLRNALIADRLLK